MHWEPIQFDTVLNYNLEAWLLRCAPVRRIQTMRVIIILLVGNRLHWKMFTIFFPPSVSLSSCRINQSELCRRRKKKVSNFEIQFYQGTTRPTSEHTHSCTNCVHQFLRVRRLLTLSFSGWIKKGEKVWNSDVLVIVPLHFGNDMPALEMIWNKSESTQLWFFSDFNSVARSLMVSLNCYWLLRRVFVPKT